MASYAEVFKLLRLVRRSFLLEHEYEVSKNATNASIGTLVAKVCKWNNLVSNFIASNMRI